MPNDREFKAIPIVSLPQLELDLAKWTAEGWDVMGPLVYTHFGTAQGGVLLSRYKEGAWGVKVPTHVEHAGPAES